MPPRSTVTREEIIAGLQRLHRELGASPTERQAIPSLGYAAKRVFGSHNAALQAAGLPTRERTGGSKAKPSEGAPPRPCACGCRELVTSRDPTVTYRLGHHRRKAKWGESRFTEDWRARALAEPGRSRCAACDWEYEGPMADAIEAFRDHRLDCPALVAA